MAKAVPTTSFSVRAEIAGIAQFGSERSALKQHTRGGSGNKIVRT
jgi:hypothetical protein